MPAYCLFDNLEVTDPSKLEKYKIAVAPIVQRYGGKYVVLGGPAELVEGTWKPNFPVMIEFPSLKDAHAWYHSDEYREVKALRLAAGRFNGVILEGL